MAKFQTGKDSQTRWYLKLRRVWLPLLMFPALASLHGCGNGEESAMGELKGRVTLDGEPVKAGRMRAVTEAGVSSPMGGIQPTGEYVIPKVPLGKVALVYVAPVRMIGKLGPGPKPPAPGTGKSVNSPSEEDNVIPAKKLELYKSLERISAKYYDPAGSGLSTTVSQGPNEFDVKMKTK